MLLPAGLVVVILSLLLPLAVNTFTTNILQQNQTVKQPDDTGAKIKDITPPEPSGTVVYGGSTSVVVLDNIVRPILEKLFNGNIKLENRFSGTVKGRENNDLQFFFASRAVDKLRTESKHILDDAIAVVVNPDLPVQPLTIEVLSKIVAGEVSNWNQIINSGESIPITVYYRSDSGTHEFLKEVLPLTQQQREKAFKDGNFVPLITHSPLNEARAKIKIDRGGIYFVTATESVFQCEFKPVPIVNSENKPVAPYEGTLIPRDSCTQIRQENRNKVNIAAIENRTYPLIRPIYLVLQTDDVTAKKWGEYYLDVLRTQEGKALTRKAGFLPR